MKESSYKSLVLSVTLWIPFTNLSDCLSLALGEEWHPSIQPLAVALIQVYVLLLLRNSLPILSRYIRDVVMRRIGIFQCLLHILVHIGIYTLVLTAWNECGALEDQETDVNESSTIISQEQIKEWAQVVFVHATLLVGLHALPELTRLNGLPDYWVVLFLSPLLLYSQQSTTIPNFLLLWQHENLDYMKILVPILPQLVGGVLSGVVARTYFPDEEDEDTQGASSS